MKIIRPILLQSILRSYNSCLISNQNPVFNILQNFLFCNEIAILTTCKFSTYEGALIFSFKLYSLNILHPKLYAAVAA